VSKTVICSEKVCKNKKIICSEKVSETVRLLRMRRTWLPLTLRRGRRGRECGGWRAARTASRAFDRIRYRHHDASVFLYAFDLIELNGDGLRRDPLAVRKATLASLLTRLAPGLRFNEHMDDTDGRLVFAHACKMGLEGIVSKRKGSPYRSGRSPDCGSGRRTRPHPR
jgi:hypothetical protein